MRDTSEEAEKILRERTLRMTPSERFEEGVRLCQFAREVMRAGIRSRHAEYSPSDVEDALARLLWGDELFRAARPGAPLLDP